MSLRYRRRASASALAVALLATTSAGCVTRAIRQTVYDDQHTEVFLRSQVKAGETVDRGFKHPLAIAPVRVAHILSRIELRTDGKKGTQRAPAVPVETLYQIAEGVSQALEKANPNQEVVVLSIRKTKRFKLFDRDYLTSFLTYAKEDELFIHFSRSEWELPVRREERPPEPHVGEHEMKFRVVPGKAMILVDPQSVAVAWRDPIFREPSTTRILPGGRVVQRTILMESPEEELGEPAPEDRIGEGLSPETLRQLGDLEEMRHRGEITEAQYKLRRREILQADPSSR
jgi:hypothetical protein